MLPELSTKYFARFKANSNPDFEWTIHTGSSIFLGQMVRRQTMSRFETQAKRQNLGYPWCHFETRISMTVAARTHDYTANYGNPELLSNSVCMIPTLAIDHSGCLCLKIEMWAPRMVA